MHHCPVLLQIAVLLSAPSASSHGHILRNCGGSKGNGTLPGSLDKLDSRRRFVRGAGGQEPEKRGALSQQKPKFRLRDKNAAQPTSSGSRFSDKQMQAILTTLARLSIRHEDSINTLRQDTGFCSVYESRIPRAGAVDVACGRTLEEAPHRDTIGNREAH